MAKIDDEMRSEISRLSREVQIYSMLARLKREQADRTLEVLKDLESKLAEAQAKLTARLAATVPSPLTDIVPAALPDAV